MITFLADECCDGLIVRTLRNLGYDVKYVAEFDFGDNDSSILELARQEQRILITEDSDFSTLVMRHQKPTYGFIFVRILAKDRHLKGLLITELVKNHESELVNAITVLTVNRIRIRPLSK